MKRRVKVQTWLKPVYLLNSCIPASCTYLHTYLLLYSCTCDGSSYISFSRSESAEDSLRRNVSRLQLRVEEVVLPLQRDKLGDVVRSGGRQGECCCTNTADNSTHINCCSTSLTWSCVCFRAGHMPFRWSYRLASLNTCCSARRGDHCSGENT